jgi:hypothetical protein
VLLWALGIFLFAFGIHRGMTMDVFVLLVLAPLTPAIHWGVREIRKNSSAADDLSKLQTYIDELWHKALPGSLTDKALEEESVLIQNQIFPSRSKNPFVFNWVYRLLRGAKEKTMHQVAGGKTQQRVRARLYPRDKVRAPAIERLLRRGCFPPKLPPAAVPAAISHLRFPYAKITVPAALCHALSFAIPVYLACSSVGRFRYIWRFSRSGESTTYAPSAPLLVRSPPPLPELLDTKAVRLQSLY